MIEIKVSFDDGASKAITALLSSLTGARAAQISEVAGSAARDSAIKYHRGFEAANRWRGTKYLGAGPGGSSFGSEVADGWFLSSHTAGGAVIENGARYYHHKVHGGTIKPKNGKLLTIPLVQEAKGRTAAVYQRDTGHKLFFVKGKRALFERIETITSGARGRRSQGGATRIKQSGLRAIYALVTSVTQGPWKGALPPEDLIAAAYTDQYREELIEIITNS